MDKTQVIVELVNVEFYCSNRDEALRYLMYIWANERALPIVESLRDLKI